jgi:hypothetical protein
VGGDTVHGGMAYLFDPDDYPVKYHPSLHFVFGSRRFKQQVDAVSLSYQKGVYLPEAYAQDLDDEMVLKKWKEGLKEMDELSTTIFSRKSVRDKAYDMVEEKMKEWEKKKNKKSKKASRASI